MNLRYAVIVVCYVVFFINSNLNIEYNYNFSFARDTDFVHPFDIFIQTKFI